MFIVRNKLMLRVLSILKSIIYSGLSLVIIYAGIQLNIHFWPLAPIFTFGAFIVFLIISVSSARLAQLDYHSEAMRKGRRYAKIEKSEVNEEQSSKTQRQLNSWWLDPQLFQLLVTLFAVMCVCWSFPALIIYWFLNPNSPKGAIQVFAVIICAGGSIIHYYKIKRALPTLGDRITYFTSAILGPATVIQFIL